MQPGSLRRTVKTKSVSMNKVIAAFGIVWAVSGIPCFGEVVTDALLFEADANNDPDPNDGWDYTGAMADGPASLSVDLTLGGALERLVEGTQAYFHRTADDRFFLGTLENSASVSDWTVEVWVRKDVTGDASLPEDQVFNVRDASFTEFISISGSGHAAPIDEPDFDHRDFNGGGARSQIDNAFTWPDDVWQQWVATYRDSDPGQDNGVLTIYLNGAQVAQDSNQKPTHAGSSTFDTMGLFVITSAEWNRGLSGDLAVIRFYGKALSAEDVARNFNATGMGLGLVAPAPGIASVTVTDPVAHRFTGESGVVYELHGSIDGTNFTATGAMVRGTGGEQDVYDPSGVQKAAYRLVPRM